MHGVPFSFYRRRDRATGGTTHEQLPSEPRQNIGEMPSGPRTEQNRAKIASTKTDRKRAKGEAAVVSTKAQQMTLI